MFHSIIRIKNEMAEIPRAGRETAEMLELQKLPTPFIRTINLGLEEVTSNIIKYGYDDDRERWIEIALDLTASELQITVTDDGREFNPLNHPDPDPTRPIDDREPGGLGVYFYRRLFDEVQYQRHAQRNILILRKSFDEAQSPSC